MSSNSLKITLPIAWLPFWNLYSSPLIEFQNIMLNKGGMVNIFSPLRYILVSEPECSHHILCNDETLFSRNIVDYKLFENYVGRGIISKEGDEWAKISQIEKPFIKKLNKDQMRLCINNVLEKYIPKIESHIEAREAIDIGTLMARITFDFFTEYVFGVANNDHEICDYYEKMSMPKSKALSYFFPSIYSRHRKTTKLYQDRFTAYVKKMGRMSDKFSCASLYSHMKNEFPEDELVKELKVLLFSGHSTLAALLTWAFYSLSVEKKATEKVYQYIDKQASDEINTFSNDSELAFFLYENMRLYPPVWLLPRRCIKTHTFGDITLRKGTTMLISPWTLHRNPSIWPSPEKFDPHRFQNLTPLQRKSYIPFSVGKRQCMGKNFALLSAHEIMSTLLHKFRVTHSKRLELNYTSLVSVKSDVRFKLKLETK